MTAATLEETSDAMIDPELLVETFSMILGHDAAVRRKANRQQTANDELLLSSHGIVGGKFNAEAERVHALDLRKARAGNPKEYAAAQQRLETAETDLRKAKATIEPKIAELRKQMIQLAEQIAAHEKTRDECKAKVDDMTASRRLIEERQLPESIRAAIAVLERPVYARFKPAFAEARQELAQATVTTSVDGKAERIEEAKRRIKEIEQQQAAELAQTARELKDFYYDL